MSNVQKWVPPLLSIETSFESALMSKSIWRVLAAGGHVYHLRLRLEPSKRSAGHGALPQVSVRTVQDPSSARDVFQLPAAFLFHWFRLVNMKVCLVFESRKTFHLLSTIILP